MPTLAILGGGPIGLACLARARAAGWDAHLFERGRIGENVRAWGHVRMFSPLAMNIPAERPPAPTRAGSPTGTGTAHGNDALLTGAEYVTDVLEPLAAAPALAGRLHLDTDVVAIAREGLRKSEAIAAPRRQDGPFRLLLRDAQGERAVTAAMVVDATGTYGQHNWLGPGGSPAIGERLAEPDIVWRLPDIPSRDRATYAGRHTLVVGAGHSAATAVVWLAAVAENAPGTRVTWLTRASGEQPVAEIAADPLPERDRIARAANAHAAAGAAWLTRVSGARILELRRTPTGYAVTVANGGEPHTVAADRILALVGYRPDLDLTRELQVQTCWATEGTYPLAAALLAQAGVGADCLAGGAALDAATLRHPEADFFTLGMKSYGRNPNFLLRAGFQQIDALFGLLRQPSGGPQRPETIR